VFWGLIRTTPEKRDMAHIEAEAERTGQQFQVLEQGLENKHFVAGKAFTMGDIAIGVNVYRWYALPIRRPALPRVEAYYARLKQRAPFQKHVMLPLT
jgi:glutathione S-transferase